jgi:hypothetical protein
MAIINLRNVFLELLRTISALEREFVVRRSIEVLSGVEHDLGKIVQSSTCCTISSNQRDDSHEEGWYGDSGI